MADPGTLWPLLQRAPCGPLRVASLVGWELVFSPTIWTLPVRLLSWDRGYLCHLVLSPRKMRVCEPLQSLSSPHRCSCECGTCEDRGSQGKAAHVHNAPSYSFLLHLPLCRTPLFHCCSRELGYLIHGRHTLGIFFDFLFKVSLKLPCTSLSLHRKKKKS